MNGIKLYESRVNRSVWQRSPFAYGWCLQAKKQRRPIKDAGAHRYSSRITSSPSIAYRSSRRWCSWEIRPSQLLDQGSRMGETRLTETTTLDFVIKFLDPNGTFLDYCKSIIAMILSLIASDVSTFIMRTCLPDSASDCLSKLRTTAECILE